MSLELKKRIITSFFLFSLLLLMFHFSFILVITIIIIAIINWIEFYALLSKIFKKNNIKQKIYRFLGKAFSLFYLIALVFLIFLNFEQKNYIFFILSVSIASDMGGLTIGRIFKGKKLSKISPNKTISGSIGSFIFSLSLIPIFYEQLIIVNIYSLILFTFLISLITQLGDLFISFLKRKAHVKNTSDLLPGHGGFLDRTDGIIFAVPLGILLLSFF